MSVLMDKNIVVYLRIFLVGIVRIAVVTLEYEHSTPHAVWMIPMCHHRTLENRMFVSKCRNENQQPDNVLHDAPSTLAQNA